MKKMLSLAAVACLMITGAMAEDLSEAFKNGKVSGIFVAGNNIDKIGAMHLSKYVSKKVQQLIKLMEQEDKRILP